MSARMGMAAEDRTDQSSKLPASIGRGSIYPKPPLFSITHRQTGHPQHWLLPWP